MCSTHTSLHYQPITYKLVNNQIILFTIQKESTNLPMDKRTKKQQDQQEPAGQSSGVKIVSRAGKELVVEVYGEASQCLDDVGDNNPAVLLDWKPDQVRAAVALANRSRPSLPSWMKPDGYPITEERLEQALLKHVANAGSGLVVGRFLVAQNTSGQYGRIRERLSHLMIDPFILEICEPEKCRPLAEIYTFADEQRKTTAVATPCLPFPKGFICVKAFQ